LAGGVAAVASGEAALGIFPKSEIVAFDGVTLAGALPPPLQLNIVYGAGIVAASSVAEPAAEFIRFLIEPESRKVWTACGFDPPAT
jgi:ABC-type molybdate transport system substrate-binding protein